ncbi:MAG: hypothetical protein SGILL_006656, partial [Bacillariaceae sp.]
VDVSFQRYETSSRHWLSSSQHDIDDARSAEPKQSKKGQKQQEYDLRRQRWLDRYGSLEALQTTFGTGRPDNNSTTSFFAGDLTPAQTRRLYHTLLPRTLLGLYELGLMNPEELAPMAYEARMAAKQYARSRCVWYARMATELFDQYRSVRDRGRIGTKTNQGSGMTWEEIYSKYEAQIVQEECEAVLQKYSDKDDRTRQRKAEKKLKRLKDDEDLTMSIYTRILEKSCATNQAFDKMFLRNRRNHESDDGLEEVDDVFNQIAQQLDQDVRTILLGPKDVDKEAKKMIKLERQELKAQKKEERKREKLQQKDDKRRQKEARRRLKEETRQKSKRKSATSGSTSLVTTTAENGDHHHSSKFTTLR